MSQEQLTDSQVIVKKVGEIVDFFQLSNVDLEQRTWLSGLLVSVYDLGVQAGANGLVEKIKENATKNCGK